MKMNMKRAICFLLVLVMTLSFAACGKKEGAKLKNAEDMTFDIESDGQPAGDDNQAGGNGATGDNTGATTSNGNGGTTAGQGGSNTAGSSKNLDDLSWKELLAQMPSNLRGTTIRVASWNPIKDVTGAQRVIDSFTKQTGIKVKWEQINYEQYDEQIAAYINGGNAPDLFRYQHCTPSKMSMAQDLKTATGQDFKGNIWDKSTRDLYTINGKTYGINLANTFNMQPMVVHYSQATIENNNMEDPYVLWKKGQWTYDKFKSMCADFRQKTGQGGWMTSYRVDILSMRGLQLITFDGKKYVNATKKSDILLGLQEACNNYKKEICTSTMREHKYLENGQYLFFTDNIIGSRRTDFHFSTLKANGDLRCVPIPAEKGKTYYQPMHESEAYGVPKGAKNPKAVYYFLRYYLDANNYDAETFFVNDQALEVYKWCISQKNKYHLYDFYAGLPTFVKEGTAAQAKTELDKVNNLVEAEVKEWNKTIAKFK